MPDIGRWLISNSYSRSIQANVYRWKHFERLCRRLHSVSRITARNNRISVHSRWHTRKQRRKMIRAIGCTRLYPGRQETERLRLSSIFRQQALTAFFRRQTRHLLPMSDNQFQLYRQTNAVGKQTNTFLDLEVLDISTGKRRPVEICQAAKVLKHRYL